jgi:serine phosphatase RsbU (regulator of sigma subunit)
MQLKSIAEGCWELGAEPSAFLGRMNNELARFVVVESFATAFYGVLDAASGRFAFASAGHPPALRLTASGEAPKLETMGAPLGIIEDHEYEGGEAELEPGDMVLSYTDGATEVPDAEGVFLGEDGLAALALEERQHGDRGILERVYQRVKESCAKVVLPDDLTLLSVTYGG